MPQFILDIKLPMSWRNLTDTPPYHHPFNINHRPNQQQP